MTFLETEISGGRVVQLTQLHLFPTLRWRTEDPTSTEQHWRELLTRLFGTAELPILIRPGAEKSWITCSYRQFGNW